MNKTQSKKIIALLIIVIGILTVCLSFFSAIVNGIVKENDDLVAFLYGMQLNDLSVTDIKDAVIEGDKTLTYMDDWVENPQRMSQQALNNLFTHLNGFANTVKPQQMSGCFAQFCAGNELSIFEQFSLLVQTSKKQEVKELLADEAIMEMLNRMKSKDEDVLRTILSILSQQEWQVLLQKVVAFNQAIYKPEYLQPLLDAIESIYMLYLGAEEAKQMTAEFICEEMVIIKNAVKLLFTDSKALQYGLRLIEKVLSIKQSSLLSFITPINSVTLIFINQTLDLINQDTLYNLYLDYDYYVKKDTTSKLAVEIGQYLLPIYERLNEQEKADFCNTLDLYFAQIEQTKYLFSEELVAFAERYAEYNVRKLTVTQIKEIDNYLSLMLQ